MSHMRSGNLPSCERQIKKWDRAWKLALIERDNPQWRDLWMEIATG